MDEKELANYPGLYPRKNGAWYVRKAIPTGLKGLYTGDQIRKSLHTSDKKEAIRLYLISHGRPMDEVVAPHRKDIALEYERGFVGMTDRNISLAELLSTREALINAIIGQMPEAHRQLVVSFVKCEAIDWSAAGLPDVSALPAIQWRRRNLDTLSAERRSELADLLAHALMQ